MAMMVFTRNHQYLTGEAMLIKTLLNKVECFNSFISVNFSFMSVNVGDEALIVDIRSRRNSKPVCHLNAYKWHYIIYSASCQNLDVATDSADKPFFY
jgi:hypothetical protein